MSSPSTNSIITLSSLLKVSSSNDMNTSIDNDLYSNTIYNNTIIQSYLNLLTSSFLSKGNLYHYFYNHLYNDPDVLKYKYIYILVQNSSMVSTVRVFNRSIYRNDAVINIGGIGEVGTLEEYRNVGYATSILNYIKKELVNNNIHLSVLHTTKYTKFYQKLGWVPIPRYFITIDCNYLLDNVLTLSKSNNYIDNCLPIKDLLNPDNILLRNSLFKLYDDYSKSFFGPIKRSENYWLSWIGSSLEFNYYYILQNNELIGYMMLDFDNISNTIKLKDFASNGDWNVFSLLNHYIYNSNLTSPKIKLPLPVISKFLTGSSISCESYSIEVENGFHYLNLNDTIITLPLENIEPMKSNHIFWDVDGY